MSWRVIGPFLTALVAERGRWPLWLPVGFGIGIALYFSHLEEPPVGFGPLAVLGSLAVALTLARKSDEALPTVVRLAFLAAAVVAFGFTAASVRTLIVTAAVLEKPVGPTTLTGRVQRVETFPSGLRIVVEKPRISGISAHMMPEKVRVRLMATQPDLWPGDWVRVRARLSPPPPPVAPGAYDFQRWAFFEGLGAVGFGLGKATVLATGTSQSGVTPEILVERLRRAITKRILAAVEGETGGVVAALITGERRAVPEDVMEALRRSGLAHLLAISGLHIGLAAVTVFSGLRLILAAVPGVAVRFPIKKAAAFGAILAAFGYALIAGATLPTQRAFIMLCFALVAVIIDRRGLSVRSVAWAAFLVLLFTPESLLGASFQMSFAAVLALVAAYEALSSRDRSSDSFVYHGPWRGVALYFGGVLLTTLVASAATGSFALFHFNRFADYGMAANLVAVPITALWIMPWSVVAMFLMPFGLEAAALTPAAWGVDGVVAVARTVSAWPGAVTLAPAMPVWGLAAITFGGLWLCIWRRRFRYLGTIPIAVGFASFATVSPPDVWVDSEARVFALRGADGEMRFSAGTGARHVRKTWLRMAGHTEAGSLPRLGSLQSPHAPHCDAFGCLAAYGNRKVAIGNREEALSEDCWSADVVISLIAIRHPCPAPVVIDRFDLWRNGAHTIRFGGTGPPVIDTVAKHRGNRPWVPRKQRVRRDRPGTGKGP